MELEEVIGQLEETVTKMENEKLTLGRLIRRFLKG